VLVWEVVEVVLLDLLVVVGGATIVGEGVETLEVVGGGGAEVVGRVVEVVGVVVGVAVVVGVVVGLVVGTSPPPPTLMGTSVATAPCGRRFLSMRSACSARLTTGGARFMPWRALAAGPGPVDRNTWAMTRAKRRVKNEGFAILDNNQR
jgi:hypothetical protein